MQNLVLIIRNSYNNLEFLKNISHYYRKFLSHRRPKHIDIGIELFDSGTFFHYRSGSNWHGPSKKFAAKKNIAFNNLSKTILEE